MPIGTPVEDANQWGQEERRRALFSQWLFDAWDWAGDNHHEAVDDLAELLSHIQEVDYRLWEAAKGCGVIGAGKIARTLSRAVGLPPDGPRITGWEMEINYAPVVPLDESVWRWIHGSLGWVNRYHDTKMNRMNFWMWSPAGNIVRFVIRPELVVVEEPEET